MGARLMNKGLSTFLESPTQFGAISKQLIAGIRGRG